MTAAQRRFVAEIESGEDTFNGDRLRTALALEKRGVLKIVERTTVPNRVCGGRDTVIKVELT